MSQPKLHFIPIPPATSAAGDYAIEMFGQNLRRSWAVLSLVTIIAEIIPAVGLTSLALFSYNFVKITLFLALGYCTPLAFHQIDKLNRGLLVALVSAIFVELSQTVIGNGHSFSFVELFGKVFLIITGFAVALNARYDQVISIGKHRIRLHTDLIPRR